MTERTVYYCSYCGKEFFNKQDCEKHEWDHIDYYTNSGNKEICDKLKNLAYIAYDYSIGNSIMGMPVGSFENLMEEAAMRIEKLDQYEPVGGC